MVANIRHSGTGSPNPTKPEVGEIDTNKPFLSVRDAVSLFGRSASSGEKSALNKPKSYSSERVLANEAQLHLAQKEQNKLKEQLKNAEITKAQAQEELEMYKRTVEDLRQKLKVLSESKELAMKEKQYTKEKCGIADGIDDGACKEELENAVKDYTSAITELDVAKQELSKIRQDCHSSFEGKVSALKRAEEAEDAMKANTERASELSKEILAVQKLIEHTRLVSVQGNQQQAGVLSEKEVLRQSYKTALAESKRKLLALKAEFSPELAEMHEVQLTKTTDEIAALQKEIENKKASDLDSAKSITSDLDEAKESLQKLAEEENSLGSLVEALKLELENVQSEHSELKKKESETEAVVGNLHIELQKSKNELELCLAEESKVRVAAEEMNVMLNQLKSETENAQLEAEYMKKMETELKMEAEVTKLALEDAERKLKVALEEVEAARAAEATALHQIRVSYEKTNATLSSTSEDGAKITISREEFESLSRRVEEADGLADMKVAAAMAQVEVVKASENEELKKLQAMLKEIEDTNAATQETLKTAEAAEAAKRAVESELRRWREREQKKAAETATRIMAEAQMSSEASSHPSPQQQSVPPKKVESQKSNKWRSSSRKVLLRNISSVFHRKKNQLVDGGSPSYLPGEEPM